MSHLDVSALIAALRPAPEEFELCGGWLCHTRAGHRVHINPGGRIEIQAAGDCAVLTAQSDSQPSSPDVSGDGRPSIGERRSSIENSPRALLDGQWRFGF